MRLYVSNDSYPELREIDSRWERHKTWWRAFRSAARDLRMWGLAVSQVGVLVCGVLADTWIVDAYEITPPWRSVVHAVITMTVLVVNATAVLSWGGDVIRPHLRRVSTIARRSCPQCGYLQEGRLDGDAPAVVCPECGVTVPRTVFEPPYELPPQFRAWRLRGR